MKPLIAAGLVAAASLGPGRYVQNQHRTLVPSMDVADALLDERGEH